MKQDFKIYTGRKSKEIQNKLFELGYKWKEPNKGYSEKEVQNLDMPFIFAFYRGKNLEYTNNNIVYQGSLLKEISFEELMSIEIDKIDFYKDLMPISGFYINQDGDIKELKEHSQHYTSHLWNVYPTRGLAEANKVLATLIQWRDIYNKGSVISYNEKRYVIVNIRGCLELSVFRNTNAIFSFKDKETSERFYNDFKPQLELVKPLI